MKNASDSVGFFWIIAAANVKNLLYSDLCEFYLGLLRLDNSIHEVRSALQGKRAPYISQTHSRVYATSEEQVTALRRLCDEMETLMPSVVEMGGSAPHNPRAVVEKRLEPLTEL